MFLLFCIGERLEREIQGAAHWIKKMGIGVWGAANFHISPHPFPHLSLHYSSHRDWHCGKMMTMWRCSRYLGRRRRSITTSADSRAAVGWSWWDHAEPLPKDPIKTVTDAFISDPSPFKINLFVVRQKKKGTLVLNLLCLFIFFFVCACELGR